jgi:hypothetical protein
MTMGKRTLAALGAALTTVLGVGAATAAQPIREPVIYEDFVAENVCDFPVLIEIVANKQYVTVFPDRLVFTGKLFARLTNTVTGESLDLNISGPGFVSTAGESLRGRGLLILFEEDAGGPGLRLVSGKVDIIRAEDGFIANLSVRGHSVDVCAALA